MKAQTRFKAVGSIAKLSTIFANEPVAASDTSEEPGQDREQVEE